MATIHNIRRAFYLLSDEEAFTVIKEIRLSRRTPKKSYTSTSNKTESKSKTKQPKAPSKKVNPMTLTPEDAKRLLAILTGGTGA